MIKRNITNTYQWQSSLDFALLYNVYTEGAGQRLALQAKGAALCKYQQTTGEGLGEVESVAMTVTNILRFFFDFSYLQRLRPQLLAIAQAREQDNALLQTLPLWCHRRALVLELLLLLV